jgi:hypothetical protein
MRFLAHGKLNPAVSAALVRHGHKVVSLEEIAISQDSDAATVIESAGKRQLDVITNDSKLVTHLTNLRVQFERCVVYLQLEGAEVEQDDAIDRLFERYSRLSPGRLYTVTGTRVKVRQLPRRSTKENAPTTSR